MCDTVIVGVDPNFPVDRQTLETFDMDGVEIVDSPWDRTNRNAGSEIAIQMDALVELAGSRGSDWVVVMQADELFHDDAFDMLRTFMERSPKVTGFLTKRLYFWKNLNTVRVDWNAELVRIFRPGTYSFMADGTDKAGMYSGPIVPGEEVTLPYSIYHYSRVDSDLGLISRRVRNLDTFFHAEDSLILEKDLPTYDFVMREHDNFGKAGPPAKVEGELKTFSGTHPIGVKEWYNA